MQRQLILTTDFRENLLLVQGLTTLERMTRAEAAPRVKTGSDRQRYQYEILSLQKVESYAILKMLRFDGFFLILRFQRKQSLFNPTSH